MQAVDDPAAVRGGEPVAGEHPVSQRGVDEDQPEHREGGPRGERRPLGDGARQQRHRDDRETPLESGEGQRRDGAHGRVAVDERIEEGELERVADDATQRVAERFAVTDHRPGDAHGGGAHEAHHHHVEHALGADHASVEEGQTRCHQQHQRRAGQQPGGVARVDLVNHPVTVAAACFGVVLLELRPRDRAVTGRCGRCYDGVSFSLPCRPRCVRRPPPTAFSRARPSRVQLTPERSASPGADGTGAGRTLTAPVLVARLPL
ncbi:hypothetical protein SDC9_144520 [bioreactor metagenome]|uniref:Uncharacterized protein n=1 Tax=bioreactor metagenome TaxID=1076179 RepID=A0A645E6F0_9ZZZZ